MVKNLKCLQLKSEDVRCGFQSGNLLTGEFSLVDRYWPKVVQVGLKWDKFGTFSDQISVHFGSGSQNVLISDQNMFQFSANLTHFGSTIENVLKSDLKMSRFAPSDPCFAQIFNP